MTRMDLATLDPVDFARLARSGEIVVLTENDEPIAEVKPVDPPKTPAPTGDPDDPYGRAAAFDRYAPWITEARLREAMRPMTDAEAERFIETGEY